MNLSVCLFFVSPPGDKQIVCPWGTNISYTQEGGGTNNFDTLEGDKHFQTEGGQTFYVGGSGGYDDVYEVMDISEVNLFANSMSPSH